ncbi:hypothetical protein DFH06DRAFT_129101 [Mycena polygramma]|nr:hypothetical protein DFH06DRAFT_129101 [Mycena polygramma]
MWRSTPSRTVGVIRAHAVMLSTAHRVLARTSLRQFHRCPSVGQIRRGKSFGLLPPVAPAQPEKKDALPGRRRDGPSSAGNSPAGLNPSSPSPSTPQPRPLSKRKLEGLPTARHKRKAEMMKNLARSESVKMERALVWLEAEPARIAEKRKRKKKPKGWKKAELVMAQVRQKLKEEKGGENEGEETEEERAARFEAFKVAFRALKLGMTKDGRSVLAREAKLKVVGSWEEDLQTDKTTSEHT